MCVTAFAVLVVFMVALGRFWRILTSLGGHKPPPGPMGLPLIGNLHLLGKLPHRTLYKLSQKYGPIMSLRLGLIPTIVVSSPAAAELFLKTHDSTFANRPRVQLAVDHFYGSKTIAFAEFGAYWRSVRKFCSLELLSPTKIDSMAGLRREELGFLVDSLKEASHTRQVVDVSGKGITRRTKVTGKELDNILEIIIDDHEQEAAEGYEKPDKDFVDVLLSLKSNPTGTHEQLAKNIDRSNIKAIVLDIIFGSVGTAQTAIEWIMTELIRHKRVMKLVQEEIRNVMVNCEFVEETHLSKLEYLHMVVKESMRLHPVVPLLVPHESMEDIVVYGYYIQKKSRIIINNWGSDEILKFGRRGCPGMYLGLRNVKLVVAQLVHSFEWEVPFGMSPDALNMKETFGLTSPRAEHLLAIPKIRQI
ncbi:hypothetical protein AgCh_024862 [Apium graveolens]